MAIESLLLMKQELILIAIIFILLFLKLGKERSNMSYINLVNILLLINFVIGFIGDPAGILFQAGQRTIAGIKPRRKRRDDVDL